MSGTNHKTPAPTARAWRALPERHDEHGRVPVPACQMPQCTSTATIGSHKVIQSGIGQHVLSARSTAPLVLAGCPARAVKE